MSNASKTYDRYEAVAGRGSEGKRRCQICGKTLKEGSKFDTCFECGQKQKKTDGAGTENLPVGYTALLEKGYFNPDGRLWEEFLTTMASEVARAFRGLKNHQLRRFYGHAKAAENRLNMTRDWHAVNLDVKKLSPFVSEAKGKDKIPPSFYDFIEKNIRLVKTEKDFKEGFMEHFQAVVAYFTYHYPKS
jgi:CRISPR type III-A-associated protein Csm2